jgi:hypothetical protein
MPEKLKQAIKKAYDKSKEGTKPMNPYTRENAIVTAFKKGTSSALRPMVKNSNSDYKKPVTGSAQKPAVTTATESAGTIASSEKPAQLTRKDANKQIQQQNLQDKIDKNKKRKEDKLNKEKKKLNTAAAITTGGALLGLASQAKSLFKKD